MIVGVCSTMSHRPPELGRPTSSKRKLKDLLLQRDNRNCADCGAPDPKWASANIGVFICLKCCGVHRSLGTHISKVNTALTDDNYRRKKQLSDFYRKLPVLLVLSVTLDEWSNEEIDSMVEVGGNSAANSIYEAYIPDGFSKPKPDASHEERMKFVRSKYEIQEFLKPSLRIASTPAGKSSLQASFSRKIMDTFRSSSTQKSEGMVEFIGLVKVKIVKGTNLAVRDMLSSDPYVVLNLGHQTVQTAVVRSNLNPVWNEDLMLSVPQRYGPIKLSVYDHDTFSADDIMGEAEIDIQPLITSATAYGDAAMFGNMQIGKWLKSHDNALIEDSTINIVDGKVKQEVMLKLQNVESGDIELEIQWLALDQ